MSITAAETRTFQSLLPATGTSATFTPLDDGDGVTAEDEPEAGVGGWATGESHTSATATVPELV